MSKPILMILGILVATITLMAHNGHAKLTVIVRNVENADGHVEVTLYNSADKWLDDGITTKVVKARNGYVEITFENVKKGTYAVSVMHDENANGKLDSNVIGIPTESYGFSNNARGMFGPADYAESSFALNNDKKIEINIK